MRMSQGNGRDPTVGGCEESLNFFQEARQMWPIELAAGASSSIVVEVEHSTTNNVVIVERGTTEGAVDAEKSTEGVQTTKGVGSETLDPPSCSSSMLCASRLLHLQLYYFYSFMHWGQLDIFFLGGGVNEQ